MATLSVIIEANLAGAAWTDISNDVLTDQGLTIDWGMDGGRPDENCARPGTLRLTLNNRAYATRLEGRYSPGHTNATVGFDINTPLRVKVGDGTTTRTMEPYRIVSILPDAGQHGPCTVAVLAADWLEEAAEAPVITTNLTEVYAGALLTDMLTGMDRQPTATSFAAGATVMAYPLSDLQGRENRTLTAFKSIVQSEGGFLFLTSGGTLTFQAAALRAADTTNDYTLTNSMHGLSVTRARDALVNSFVLTVHPFVASGSLVQLAALEGTAPVARYGSTDGVVVKLEYTDPDTGLPCAGTDVVEALAGAYAYMTANSRADGLGVDMTLSCDVFTTITPTSAEIRVVNERGSYDAYVTALSVWGTSLVQATPVAAISENNASITSYGRHTLDIDMPYQSDVNVAQSLADYWRSIYADASTMASAITIRTRYNATLLGIVTAADVGTRLAITEAMTAVSESYWVQGLTLQIIDGVEAELTMRLAPASDALYWLLGTAGRSELGVTTTLGYM